MAPARLYTLIFPRRENALLLGLKKRGFGAGRWNGFGGKVEKGETWRESAARELHEESGLLCNTDDLVHRGTNLFTFDNEAPMLVQIFDTHKWTGEPTESDEMLPKWYDGDKLPWDVMWPDDQQWYPLMLQNKYFKGTFHFKDYDTITSQDLKVIDPDQLELDQLCN